jgi:hypothetical protein
MKHPFSIALAFLLAPFALACVSAGTFEQKEAELQDAIKEQNMARQANDALKARVQRLDEETKLVRQVDQKEIAYLRAQLEQAKKDAASRTAEAALRQVQASREAKQSEPAPAQQVRGELRQGKTVPWKVDSKGRPDLADVNATFDVVMPGLKAKYVDEDSPDGPTKAELAREEANDWKHARCEDTADAYRSFLEEHEDSKRYASTAMARLAAIERQEKAEEDRRARQEATEQARKEAKAEAEERSRLAVLKPRVLYKSRSRLAAQVGAWDRSAASPPNKRMGSPGKMLAGGSSAVSMQTHHPSAGPARMVITGGAPSIVNDVQRPIDLAKSAAADGGAGGVERIEIVDVKALGRFLVVDVVLPTARKTVVLDETAFREISLEARDGTSLRCEGVLVEEMLDDAWLSVTFKPEGGSVMRLNGTIGDEGPGTLFVTRVSLANSALEQEPGARFVTPQMAIIPLVFEVDSARLPPVSGLRLHFLGQVLRSESAR